MRPYLAFAPEAPEADTGINDTDFLFDIFKTKIVERMHRSLYDQITYFGMLLSMIQGQLSGLTRSTHYLALLLVLATSRSEPHLSLPHGGDINIEDGQKISLDEVR